MTVFGIQRRMMRLGRVRLGEKGTKGEPRRRDTFRFTSASRELLESVALTYGGKVEVWNGAPEDGMFEVNSDATQIDILIPPVLSSVDGSPSAPYSQFYELWSGGGCQRRCDGVTDAISGKSCLCRPAVEESGEEMRECKITTRCDFMIPSVAGLGTWGLESHGWNAAIELPGTLDLLMLAAAEQRFIPAVLRIDHRTKKTPGRPTNRYVVPVIDLPGVSVAQLAQGNVPSPITALPAPVAKPALPAGADLPVDASFEDQAPALPSVAAPGTPDEAEILEGELLILAGQLGVYDETQKAIGKPRTDQVKWLKAQIKRAQDELDARSEPSQFPIPAGVGDDAAA